MSHLGVLSHSFVLSLCGMSIEPIEFLTECVPTISAKEWGADSIGPKVGGALFRWQGALGDLDALAQRFWPVHLALHLQLTVIANETVKDKLCRQNFLRRRNCENFKMGKQFQDPLCLAGLENLRDIFEKKSAISCGFHRVRSEFLGGLLLQLRHRSQRGSHQVSRKPHRLLMAWSWRFWTVTLCGKVYMFLASISHMLLADL
jgi:hypothetical protein